jgi:uncharacterized membrane protein YdjX (TVP38/TMEM64 family)
VGESLWLLCLLLFVDGATFAFATTPLLLEYGKYHAPWLVALAGGAASALGSAVQLLALRWALASGRPWMHRLAPSRDRVEAALRTYPAATFLAILLARATPLPDAPIKLVVAAGGYPVTRYALALLLGALPYYFVLAWLGRVVRIPTWVTVTAVAVIALAIAADRLRRRAAAKRRP